MAAEQLAALANGRLAAGPSGRGGGGRPLAELGAEADAEEGRAVPLLAAGEAAPVLPPTGSFPEYSDSSRGQQAWAGARAGTPSVGFRPLPSPQPPATDTAAASGPGAERQQREQQRVQQLTDTAVEAELAELNGGALQTMLAASRTVPGGDSIGAFFAHVAATAAKQQPPAQAQAQGWPSTGGREASPATAGAAGNTAVRVDAPTSVGLMQQAAVLIRGLHEELQKSRREVRGACHARLCAR